MSSMYKRTTKKKWILLLGRAGIKIEPVNFPTLESKLIIPRPISEFQTILSRNSFEGCDQSRACSSIPLFRVTQFSYLRYSSSITNLETLVTPTTAHIERVCTSNLPSRSLDFPILIVAMLCSYILHSILDKIFFFSSTRVPSRFVVPDWRRTSFAN